MSSPIVNAIRKALQDSASEENRQASNRFYKKGEEALVHGVKNAAVRSIAKEFLKQIKSKDKAYIFNICEELWQSGYLEEAIVACVFSESLKKKYLPEDFEIFERWVTQYVNNWAGCDTLCNHTVGTFIMMYPEYIKELKKWASSSNRWNKRAAAVTLIVPSKQGLFLKEILEIADSLLLDKDDLVQKGYGWMLKSASHNHQTEVYEYILAKKDSMSRTALRYAIEKMPQEMKANAMKN